MNEPKKTRKMRSQCTHELEIQIYIDINVHSRDKAANNRSLSDKIHAMMNGYYMNNDANTLHEARTIVGQMSIDDLKRLLNNDDEATRIVKNLAEVSLNNVRERLSRMMNNETNTISH
jgi:hypothetical protein